MRKTYTEALRIDVTLPLGMGTDRHVFLQPDMEGAKTLSDYGCGLRQDGHSNVLFWDGVKAGEIVVQFDVRMAPLQVALSEINDHETPHQVQFDATVDGSGGLSYGMAVVGCETRDAPVRVALRLTLNDTQKPTLSLEIPPALAYWSYILTPPTGVTVKVWDSAQMLGFEEVEERTLPEGSTAAVWRSMQKVDVQAYFDAKPKAHIEGQGTISMPRPTPQASALIEGTTDVEWQAFIYLK